MQRPIHVGAFLVFTLLCRTAVAQNYSFVHFAGTQGGGGAVDATSSSVRFNTIQGVVHARGAIFITDVSNTVRRVTTGGAVTTFAGLAGESGTVDDRRYAARFLGMRGIAADSAGNLYVATGNHMIRKISPAGIVTTYAGASFVPGSTNGPRLDARFNSPEHLAIDASDNIYVADRGNHLIRKITPAGEVSTLAGTAGVSGSNNATGTAASFFNPTGIAVDNATGIVYVADFSNQLIRKITTPEGVVTTLAGSVGVLGHADLTGTAALFRFPSALAVDNAGFIYVSDGGNNRIRKITSTGTVSSVAGSSQTGFADGMGTAARFSNLEGINFEPTTGDLYIADDRAIRRMTTSGIVSTVAGHNPDFGTADGTTAARFHEPRHITTDVAGNVYVADANNYAIRKITPAGSVSTFAGTPGSPGTTDDTGALARFSFPSGIAKDASGNLYVADTNAHTIRKITTAGVVTTYAGAAGVSGSTTNVAPLSARFNQPKGVAVDAAGNVWVADTGNHTIRRIPAAGNVTTPAGSAGQPGSTNQTGSLARFNNPSALVVDDASGFIFIADESNSLIRKLVISSGVVTTFAGGGTSEADGVGTAAGTNSPTAIARDSSGNLYAATLRGIRKITTGASVTTIGRLTHIVSGIAVDASGNIYVSDRNHSIHRGSIALTDTATIDQPTGNLFQNRQLGISSAAGASWTWSIVRRPSGSSANLSSTTISNPTFAPDGSDMYVFRVKAVSGSSSSTTEVSLIGNCPAVEVNPATLPDGAVGQPYSATLSGVNGSPPYELSLVSGTLPIGLTLGSCDATSCALSGTPTLATQYDFTIGTTDNYGCTAQRAYTVIIAALPAPAGFLATATSTSSANLTWTAVPGAASYNVYRRTAGTVAASLGNTAATVFTDGTLSSSTAYGYYVRAVNGGGAQSHPSNFDATTTHTFAETLTAGATVVKASHVNEIRVAIEALADLADAGALPWTDPTLSSSLMIKRQHLVELRIALGFVHSSLGMPTITSSEPSIVAGVTTVKAIHLIELRNGTK